MFTGLIRHLGTISQKTPSSLGSSVFSITPQNKDFLQTLTIGDSISIDGVCTSVTDIYSSYFKVFCSKITLSKTTFRHQKIKTLVNLEKTLKVGDPVEGHFIYGHVESTSSVIKIQKNAKSVLIHIKTPPALQDFIFATASIAINGVSLTVALASKSSFSVNIIPITYKKTNLFLLRINSFVNIETDMLLKTPKNKR